VAALARKPQVGDRILGASNGVAKSAKGSFLEEGQAGHGPDFREF
jgi:hypothetical protein